MDLSSANIDAGFAQVRSERALQRRLDDARSVEFWRALNPDLTISDRPLCAPAARVPRAIDDALAPRCARMLATEGYFFTPPIVPLDELRRLLRGIERIVSLGLPSAMAAVYDEYYALFAGLEPLLEPLLGPDYVHVTDGLWAFYVPPGDAARMLWSAADPHRDAVAPDLRTMAGHTPSILTLWLALDDVTVDHSCIYVVPRDADPGFDCGDRRPGLDDIRWQDIRALPVPAGTLLGWSGHLLHWGSAASRFVTTPRAAVTMYVQRADVPLWRPFVMRPDAPAPLMDRLRWIECSMARPGLFTGLSRP